MADPKLSPLLKPFLFLLFLSLFLILFLSVPLFPEPATVDGTKSSRIPDSRQVASPGIRIRRNFQSYDEYIKLQLNKTLDPRLRAVWATRDWDRKVVAFAAFFSRLESRGFLSASSRALCVGARLGQEVEALRRIGVADAVGIDLAAAPPLVVEGDFHAQPFEDAVFDFEFSNVLDHALYPDRFAAEIERTLRSGGIAVLHVAVHRRGDKYSANDIVGGVEGVVALFKNSEVTSVEKVDAFGLDTEIVLRKKTSTAA